MPSTRFAYVNGRFYPESSASVPISDTVFLHGFGVFETMRVYDGRLFRERDHLARLFDALGFFKMPCALSAEEIRVVNRVLIQRNNVSNGVARVAVTNQSLVVTVRPAKFQRVPRCVIVSRVRLEPVLSRFKTANRLPYILAQREAEQAGANDAVLRNHDGNLVELTTCNLFMVRDGCLWTPPLSDGALPGITRAVVLELARENDWPLRVESLQPQDLERADELFGTNSLVEIVPVTWPGMNPKSGRWTTRLIKAYRQRVRDELMVPTPG